MTLSDLGPGQTGIVESVGIEGALRRRLHDMGLRKGALIHVEKYAPLGDPMELRIQDFHLAIRRHDAALIAVKKA